MKVLVFLLLSKRIGIIRMGNQRIGCRIENLGVDAVKNAGQVTGTRPENAIQSFTVIWRPYLLSVRRADGDKLIRENNAGFQKIGG